MGSTRCGVSADTTATIDAGTQPSRVAFPTELSTFKDGIRGDGQDVEGKYDTAASHHDDRRKLGIHGGD